MSQHYDFVVDLADQKQPTSIPRLTLADWRAEVERRGGLDCVFTCPLCGNGATPRQFCDAGAEMGRAPHECIGRVVGAKGGFYLRNGKPNPNRNAQPCDWAAFGLLGTLDSGIAVVMPDGSEVSVFSFAEEAS